MPNDRTEIEAMVAMKFDERCEKLLDQASAVADDHTATESDLRDAVSVAANIGFQLLDNLRRCDEARDGE